MASVTLPSSEELDTSRYECVDGRITERPLPSSLHSDLQFTITSRLKRQIEAKQLPLVARQEWTLDKADEPGTRWMTPDVLVTSKDAPETAGANHALPPAFLAVEILSRGQTFEGMRRLKALPYLDWGVEFVWIVDPFERVAYSISRAEHRRLKIEMSIVGDTSEPAIVEAGKLFLSLDCLA